MSRNDRPGFHDFMQYMLRPQPSAEEQSKEKLRARLRRHIEAMIPEVDDTNEERGFAVAQRIASRDHLVRQIANSMVEPTSGGFKFLRPLHDDWVRILRDNKFRLYRRDDKSTTRIYLPGASKSLLRNSMRNKPWHEVSAS